MAWTYSGDPTSSDRDKVRFLIGDTDTNDQLLQDGEIDYLITLKGSAEGAAYQACATLMAKYAREVDYAIGPEKAQASQRLENFKKVMESLRQLNIGTYAAPSFQDPLAEGADPIFDIGMHDAEEPGSGLDG
jgi:hypothetical protein